MGDRVMTYGDWYYNQCIGHSGVKSRRRKKLSGVLNLCTIPRPHPSSRDG
jgi:hypothetical protein